MTEGAGNGSTPSASAPVNAKKRKCDHDDEPQVRPPKQRKKPKKKAKKASSKKMDAVKSEGEGGGVGGSSDAGVVKINPHRAKILVAKQALAAIKEGTSELCSDRSLLASAICKRLDEFWCMHLLGRSKSGLLALCRMENSWVRHASMF